MSRKKTYVTDYDKLRHVISKWGQYKSTATDCLTLVETANQELQAYLTNHIPLSNPDYEHLRGFRRANRCMSDFITRLPAYLKQIEEGSSCSPVDEETLEKLKIIAREATEWKIAYNKAVAKYKELATEYEATFYNNDGTFDITRWLE